MTPKIWNKRELCEAINQHVDRSGLGNDYIMPHDITEDALEDFQAQWDLKAGNPGGHETELIRLYQNIVARWK